MANFKQTSWYQLNIAGSAQSMVGTGLFDEGKGSVFFAVTNTSDPQQQWQLFAFNSSYYVLRTRESGKFGYMCAGVGTDKVTPGNTVPSMRNVTLADNSMFWTISPWGDGTFYFTNAANGTEWHLDVQPNSLLSMSSNITAPQTRQSFSFAQQGDIVNMPGFSSVSVPSTLSTSTSTPAPVTSTPGATGSSSSSRHSHGAKVGIAAGIASVAVILLLSLGIWVFLRRKRRSRSSLISPSEVQELAPLSNMSGSENSKHHPQELDPATGARFEMEAAERNERRANPYSPESDVERKVVLPQTLIEDHVVHEMDAMDAMPMPVKRVESPMGEHER